MCDLVIKYCEMIFFVIKDKYVFYTKLLYMWPVTMTKVIVFHMRTNKICK